MGELMEYTDNAKRLLRNDRQSRINAITFKIFFNILITLSLSIFVFGYVPIILFGNESVFRLHIWMVVFSALYLPALFFALVIKRSKHRKKGRWLNKGAEKIILFFYSFMGIMFGMFGLNYSVRFSFEVFPTLKQNIVSINYFSALLALTAGFIRAPIDIRDEVNASNREKNILRANLRLYGTIGLGVALIGREFIRALEQYDPLFSQISENLIGTLLGFPISIIALFKGAQYFYRDMILRM